VSSRSIAAADVLARLRRDEALGLLARRLRVAFLHAFALEELELQLRHLLRHGAARGAHLLEDLVARRLLVDGPEVEVRDVLAGRVALLGRGLGITSDRAAREGEGGDEGEQA